MDIIFPSFGNIVYEFEEHCMSEAYIVASDLGSGGCKTIVMDLDGQVVATAQQEYPTHYPNPGWVEQDPEDWYTAFCATVRAALDQVAISPGQVAGVGIVGVTHNVVLLDEQDCPLCPTILIFDSRSALQVQTVLGRWGDEVWERTLNDITPVWTWPQLLWIRQNMPDVWRGTRRILFQKDYVRHRLAPAPVTDVIDAGGTLFFDPVREEWIEPFCDDLELDPSWLPQIVEPMDVVAKVSPQGADDTGLAAGTPVIAGTTDTAAEVLGSGAVRPGIATVKLASVGRIAAVTDKPLYSHHIFNYRHVFDNLWYPGTASKSAASSYRWLRDVAWADESNKDVYEVMGEAAAQVPPGSDGLIFHPHLLGEWAPHWDDQMRGSFVGLTARHTRGHLARAVLEGVAFSLKDALSEMEGLGLQARDVRLIGQGSKSRLWSEIVANVLDRPLSVPEQPDAAYGTALIAAMGVGAIERTPEAIESVINMRWSIEPDPDLSGAYAKLFDTYRDVDAALCSINARLHEFEHQQSIKSTEI
jgi:xylulokinase